MKSDRLAQVSRIYHDALARDAGERAAYLREACAGDDGLRGEVQALLDQPASARGIPGGRRQWRWPRS